MGQISKAQIKAVTKGNTLIFLHGLLGAGRTWR